MIERYSRAEMSKVWSQQSRYTYMLEIEKAVADAQGKKRIIPKKSAEVILKKAKFNLAEISEIEKTTKHDVIAFVSSVANSVGEEGKYVHYAMTSSDVLDSATSLQVHEAYQVLEKTIHKYEKELLKKIKLHKSTLCAGRTHGMHAEITTFGYKLAGFYQELLRNKKRMSQAIEQFCVIKLSGAVGTYSVQSPEVEKAVAKKYGFIVEPAATQVIPRDRHAQLFQSFSLLAASLERFGVELRHLQRTEVSEVVEGFSVGQKGSSAMPHKKNPISAENICGLARLLRSYEIAALENVALWHERDISHSSVERVIFADAFILLDYLLDRMTQLLSGLYIDQRQMLKNIEMSRGNLYSSFLLSALVKKGWSRELAYKKVQSLSHSMTEKDTLQAKVVKDIELKKVFSTKEIKEIFSAKELVQKISARIIEMV